MLVIESIFVFLVFEFFNIVRVFVVLLDWLINIINEFLFINGLLYLNFDVILVIIGIFINFFMVYLLSNLVLYVVL